VSEWASTDDARRWLAYVAKLDMRETLDRTYKQAARTEHPDAGGSDQRMAKVNRAHDYILTHDGGAK